MLFYTVLLVIVTVLPYLTGMSGLFYLGGALVLGAGFLYYAIVLMHPPSEFFAMKVFNYSIIYLMALFAFLLIDHYIDTPPLQRTDHAATPRRLSAGFLSSNICAGCSSPRSMVWTMSVIASLTGVGTRRSRPSFAT